MKQRSLQRHNERKYNYTTMSEEEIQAIVKSIMGKIDEKYSMGNCTGCTRIGQIGYNCPHCMTKRNFTFGPNGQMIRCTAVAFKLFISDNHYPVKADKLANLIGATERGEEYKRPINARIITTEVDYDWIINNPPHVKVKEATVEKWFEQSLTYHLRKFNDMGLIYYFNKKLLKQNAKLALISAAYYKEYNEDKGKDKKRKRT